MLYNIRDVFDIAVRIEQNGAAFYRNAAKTVSGKEAKEFMTMLSIKEEEHESFFQTLRKKLQIDDDIEVAIPDEDNIILKYLQMLVDGEVFVNIKPSDEIFVEGVSMETLLKVAINFEKDTIIYFTSVKELLHLEEDKDQIDFIIREEMEHLITLVEELHKVKGDK